MSRRGWSATPLKTRGFLVVILVAASISVLWLWLGMSLFRSNTGRPFHDTIATLLRVQTAVSEDRSRAYAGGEYSFPQPDPMAEVEALRARITDATGQQLFAALLSAIVNERAALARVRSEGVAVRDNEVRGYAAFVGASQALRVQHESWLASVAAASQARSGRTVFAFLAGSALVALGGVWLLVRRRGDVLQLLRVREQEMRGRNADLAAVNKELDTFSYSVSHDLRAPLWTIAGFSQMLEQDVAGQLNAKSQKGLRLLREAAERMGVLMDKLLDFSRVSRKPLRRQHIDLSAMAQEIVENLRRAEPHRDVQVDVSPGLSAIGDVKLLRIVMENLLGNAWKYTGKAAHAEIAFRVRLGPDGPVFQVQDNGAGFDMEYAERLFGAFQRQHPAREFEGAGVGLATVQRIVHRHGGRIWGEGAVGQGATFSMTLPLVDGATTV